MFTRLSKLASCSVGAKLINPFGIFGSCHSRDFRRRLRERYHYQPAGESGHSMGDPSDAIRMNAFLRDFVIEFGPADIDENLEWGRNAVGTGVGERSEAKRNHSGHGEAMDDVYVFFQTICACLL